MKPLLIVFATREGHTEWIAQHLAETLLRRGVFVELGNAAHLSANLNLADCYSAVILAASVHLGRHEPEMIRFVQRHRPSLEHMPNAFLSVSLSRASETLESATPEQKREAAARVEAAIAKFREETGWTPARTLTVAGALPYRRFKGPLRFFMRFIARSGGLPTDTSRDYAWTDWKELDRFIDEFAQALAGRHAATSARADAS